VRFLIDAQLPPALARYLESLGHEAVHVADIGMASARDRDIWERATTISAVLVSKDEDFVTMRALRTHGPALIWIRIGNATRRALIARFGAAFSEVLAALDRGETIVQVPDDQAPR
jgi:predicted nuclease of predicted toxin-antitoxin system